MRWEVLPWPRCLGSQSLSPLRPAGVPGEPTPWPVACCGQSFLPDQECGEVVDIAVLPASQHIEVGLHGIRDLDAGSLAISLQCVAVAALIGEGQVEIIDADEIALQ